MAYNKQGGGCVPITAKLQKTQGGVVKDPLLNVGSVATKQENSGTMSYMLSRPSAPITQYNNPPGSEGSPTPSIVLRGILGLAKFGAKQIGKTGFGKAVSSRVSSAITPKIVKEAGKAGKMVIGGSKPLYTKAGNALMKGKKIGNFILGGKSILGRAMSYGAFGLAGIAANKIFGGSDNSTSSNDGGGSGGSGKISYDDAYKKRGSQYSWMDRDTYVKEAKRQNKVFKETGKWDYKNAPKKPSSSTSVNTDNRPIRDEKAPNVGVVNKPKVNLTPGTNNPNMNLSQKEENTLIRKNKAYDKKQSKIDKARAAGNEKKAKRKEKSLRNKKRRNINKASKKQSSKAITPGNNASFDPTQFSA